MMDKTALCGTPTQLSVLYNVDSYGGHDGH